MSTMASGARAPRLVSPPREELSALRTPLEPGEKAVFDFFDSLLPKEWEIYVQPHLNGLRPDVVLLHPTVGVAVYEVKDWDATRYHSTGSPHHHLISTAGDRTFRVPNPALRLR